VCVCVCVRVYHDTLLLYSCTRHFRMRHTSVSLDTNSVSSSGLDEQPGSIDEEAFLNTMNT